jgi:hypothetical protein
MKFLKVIKYVLSDLLGIIINPLMYVMLFVTTITFAFDVGFYTIYYLDTLTMGHSNILLVNSPLLLSSCISMGTFAIVVIILIIDSLHTHLQNNMIKLEDYIRDVIKRVESENKD